MEKIVKIVKKKNQIFVLFFKFVYFLEFMSTGKDNLDRTRKDHCASSPCRNNGECVGLRTTYYCRCKSPYYGISCDKKISKREEIMDESNSSDEQDLIAYERDLQDDTEDLRSAINDQ